MAYELKKVQVVDLTSVEHAKYEVFDANSHNASFTLSSMTYELINCDNSSVAVSGSGTVDNTDTDAQGNTIKTIQAIISFTNTNISTGYYYLVFTVTLQTGEVEIFRVTYKVENYKANF